MNRSHLEVINFSNILVVKTITYRLNLNFLMRFKLLFKLSITILSNRSSYTNWSKQRQSFSFPPSKVHDLCLFVHISVEI